MTPVTEAKATSITADLVRIDEEDRMADVRRDLPKHAIPEVTIEGFEKRE